VPLLNTNPGGTSPAAAGARWSSIPSPQARSTASSSRSPGCPTTRPRAWRRDRPDGRALRQHRPAVLDLTSAAATSRCTVTAGLMTGEVAVGARFGIGDHGLVVQTARTWRRAPASISNPTPFSFVLTASVREDRRAVDDLEASYIDAPGAPSNIDLAVRPAALTITTASGSATAASSSSSQRRPPLVLPRRHRRLPRGGQQELPAAEEHGRRVRRHRTVPVDPKNPHGFLVTTTPQISLTDEQRRTATRSTCWVASITSAT